MKPWFFLVATAWVPSVARDQPWISLGLAGNLNADNAVVRQAVATWLDAGGRAVDAALMYYNDAGLRQGLEGFYGTSAASDEVFVTTKIPPEQMGFDGTLETILEAREKILPAGRSSKMLDCVLIHWPGRTWQKRSSDPSCVLDRGESAADWSVCRRESWAALRHAKAMGMVGLIGVSNYELPHLEEMDGVPDVLQIEFHPWWNRADLLQWCRERKVKLVAYSSLGGAASTWLEDPNLAQLAQREKLTVAQLLLNWAVSQGVKVIPSARSRKHMEENLACCHQALSAETLKAMLAPLEAQHRTIEPDPRWIYVPGVAATAFGGPKPPSHAHLNLFGGVEQFHFGSLRKHCWQEGRTTHLCCDPAFGPEGFSSCWTGELSFIECCTPTTDKLALHPATGDSPFSNTLVDFIVVGAGSAGSIAASRLARKGFAVVLAESGGDGLSSKNVHPNPSSAEQFDHWFVHNVEWTLGEVSRTTQIIHGRGLGGSSSVNGKIYTRTPLPFPPAMVSAAYEDVESDLLLEQDVIPTASWQRAVLDGFETAGIPYVHNTSMSFKHGVGPVQKISSCKNGGRVSAFHCALGKGDAEVLRNAHVDRVIFQDGKAIGVKLAGSETNLFCRHAVVLSAGALQTPVILVKSGVGHPMDLQRLGVVPQVSSPEVGANLQDHPYLPFRVRLSLPCVDGDGSLYAFYSNLSAPTSRPSRHRVFELQLIPRCRGQNMELKGYLILLKSEMKSGRVVVRSRDATEAPAILNNPFVGDGIDAWQLIHGLREVYQLLKANLGSLREFDPPQESMMKDGFGGQYCAQHLGLWQHPMGSARIGSVLDHHLRVRGVGELYVADASALPDWALAGHPDAGIRALGSLVAQFATQDVLRKKRVM
eukprot:s822_g28.t1